MDRRHTTYSRTSATSGTQETAGATRASGRRSGGYSAVETDGSGHDRGYPQSSGYGSASYGASGYGSSGYGSSGYAPSYTAPDQGSRDYEDYPDDYDVHDAYDGYDDDEIYEYRDEIDRRWIWVAGVAGAILLIAVICTVVILGGGDSGSVSKTIVPPPPATSQPATATAPPVATSAPPPPAPSAPLSPETVTTVPPSPTATVDPVPPPQIAPAANTITYQVTGSRQLIDMVTVVYTDQQGALQTEFNVALPWSRTVTLNPGVALTSVTATSLTGQLNCTITDGAGATLVAQNTNSMLTTCTR